GEGNRSTRPRRCRPCPSACQDGPTSRLRRRPSTGHGWHSPDHDGSAWLFSRREDRAPWGAKTAIVPAAAGPSNRSRRAPPFRQPEVAGSTESVVAAQFLEGLRL